MAMNYDSKTRKALIQFTDRDGARRSLRLSNISKTAAERFHTHVESLNEARRTNSSIRGETIAFVNELGDSLHQRLTKLDLVEPRKPSAEETLAANKPITLGEWLDRYTEQRRDVKGGTQVFYGHTKRNLLKFFGTTKPLQAFTVGDAEDFARFLMTEAGARKGRTKRGLSKATVARRFGLARSFFRSALKHELISSNPFEGADVSTTVRGNKARQRFVGRDEIQRIIEKCPDAEWRLLVALARFGGLRIPSEALSLRWCDIDWERERITVWSPKTEHHEGHESRQVPLFAELAEPLREVFEQAKPGSEYVISKHRSQAMKTETGWKAVNLRTQFLKIIRRAGLDAWPKPWQNLRATRATELAEIFPSHVAAAWLGHSEAVADEHYRQVTDDHFDRATKGAKTSSPECSALHVALQSGTELSGSEQPQPLATPSIRTKNATTYKKEAVSGRNLKPLTWAILDSNQ